MAPRRFNQTDDKAPRKGRIVSHALKSGLQILDRQTRAAPRSGIGSDPQFTTGVTSEGYN